MKTHQLISRRHTGGPNGTRSPSTAPVDSTQSTGGTWGTKYHFQLKLVLDDVISEVRWVHDPRLHLQWIPDGLYTWGIEYLEKYLLLINSALITVKDIFSFIHRRTV